ncbi:MAG: chorismate synthase, partial [Muribaculaceae bacterium]|nr:chorismate synthase [Muribaculaceae bacterium]
GDISLGLDPEQVDLSKVEQSETRCPDPATAERIKNLILDVKRDGDTIGGVVGCIVRGVPVGLGEPCFDKLQATLAAAMMSINAAKGFEYGMGFEGALHRGSEMLDSFIVEDDEVKTSTNHSGGIQGGISNGMPIYFKVAFKPVATLLREVETIDRHNNPVVLKARGRHDPCVVPRAVPVVEAMAAIVLLDAWLANKASCL